MNIFVMPGRPGEYDFSTGIVALTDDNFDSTLVRCVVEGVQQEWLEMVPDSLLTRFDERGILRTEYDRISRLERMAKGLYYRRRFIRKKLPQVVKLVETGIGMSGYSLDKPASTLGAVTAAKDMMEFTYRASRLAGEITEFHDRYRRYVATGSWDPNDIIGPAGFGDERWINVPQPLTYQIRFENDPNLANAPAQEVRIRHPLDTTVDVTTFRLGNFGFSNFNFEVPEDCAFYATRLDVSDSLGVYVDVQAGIDLQTREAYWTFTAVDTATGELPTDPYAGFLPVNDAAHRGEGFVFYTIQPKPDVQTGDVIHANAEIIFDVNDPINTPDIFNTVDIDPPVSRVNPLPPASISRHFLVDWSGEDTGAGIREYSIFVSENGGPYRPWLSGVTQTSAVFSGTNGSFYRFYSRADDYAGNIEPPKSLPEASILVARPNFPYDVNGDGTVDVIDLQDVLIHINRDEYEPQYDINDDQVIDLKDVQEMGLFWHQNTP